MIDETNGQSATVVLIPTFNEVDNIAILLRKILRLYPSLAILVVDGHSSDGTVGAVQEVIEAFPDRNIRLVEQDKRTGYGTGLCLGFAEALKENFEYIITMDGDLSHDPEYIKDFLANRQDFPLIIGSRYMNGVRVEGWQFRKLLFSKLANMYISYILVRPVWDFTSGYRLYHKNFLQHIDLNTLENQAYLIQVHLIYLAFKLHFHVKEIPIIFRDRYPGYSKIDQGARIKTMLSVLRYRAPLKEILHHLVFLKGDYKRFVDEYEDLVNPPKLKNHGQYEIKTHYTVSIGVLAYNEEKIITYCLEALQQQELTMGTISEIYVVSSGSTDQTDEIVRQFSERDSRIKLVTQVSRSGKANAINEFLQRASADIAVIQSADTIADKNTLQKLIEPFSDGTIGMVGAHPVPVNSSHSFTDYCVNKLWQLHHLLALRHPKCGEMIAFRNIIAKIPDYTAVDEAVIEAIISRTKLNLAYAPQAIVHNKGPEKIKDFLLQRRRIATGHRHLKLTMQHRVATSQIGQIWKYLLKTQTWTPRQIVFTILLIFIEGYSRFMGCFDFYIKNSNPFIWDIADSTKKM